MICAEVKSPKVLQYCTGLHGHNCCCHVYMSQTLCLQFLVHVHAPSEFHGNKATQAMLDVFCLMAIVQGQLQHMLVNEQFKNF
jgi:hypothetical protein